MAIVYEEVAQLDALGLNMAEDVAENYRLEQGQLCRFAHVCSIPDWTAAGRVSRIARLNELRQQGGRVLAARVGSRLVGVASLAAQRYSRDRMQLLTLHVDRDFRQQGFGCVLLALAEELAKQAGAAGLYISSAPKVNTVDFYMRQGAVLSPEPIAQLLAQEPDDIHLEKMWR